MTQPMPQLPIPVDVDNLLRAVQKEHDNRKLKPYSGRLDYRVQPAKQHPLRCHCRQCTSDEYFTPSEPIRKTSHKRLEQDKPNYFTTTVEGFSDPLRYQWAIANELRRLDLQEVTAWWDRITEVVC
jgi:hypothetical protein